MRILKDIGLKSALLRGATIIQRDRHFAAIHNLKCYCIRAFLAALPRRILIQTLQAFLDIAENAAENSCLSAGTWLSPMPSGIHRRSLRLAH
jgi:hypothetical protein